MARNNEERLERIAREMNHKGHPLISRVKRIYYTPFAVYWGGVRVREKQREFAEKIGWKEKNLTLANALIFGLGASTLYYFTGGESHNLFSNVDLVKDMENYAVSRMSNLFGITTQTFLYLLSSFNLGQTLFRIGYSQITEKAFPSLSLIGAVANLREEYKYLFGRKKPAEGVEPSTY